MHRAGVRSLRVVVGIGGVHELARIVASQFVRGVYLVYGGALRT
jgi:hypothetical protein